MGSNDSQRAFALIKFFSRKEHYLSFISGTSLFRTPHYYRTCEDIGRGDRNESCLLYWDRKFGGNKPKFLKPDGTNLINHKVESVLVYPSAEPYDTWLQSWAVIGPHNDFEHSLEQMQKDFGSYFVLLPASKIKHYARLVAKITKTQISYGLVSYSHNPIEGSLTVKDFKYSYQKEFRFFLGHCPKGELQDKFIELPHLKKLLLEGQSLKFTLPNGAIKYCSVGYNSTVIVPPEHQ